MPPMVIRTKGAGIKGVWRAAGCGVGASCWGQQSELLPTEAS